MPIFAECRREPSLRDTPKYISDPRMMQSTWWMWKRCLYECETLAVPIYPFTSISKATNDATALLKHSPSGTPPCDPAILHLIGLSASYLSQASSKDSVFKAYAIGDTGTGYWDRNDGFVRQDTGCRGPKRTAPRYPDTGTQGRQESD